MKKLFFLISILFIFCPVVQAEDYEIFGEELYNNTTSSIISGELDLNPIKIINTLLKNIFTEISNTKTILKSILIISIASGILKILSTSLEKTDAVEVSFFACFLLITISVVKIFQEAVGYGVNTVHTLCEFLTKFEPIFISLLYASGAVIGGSVFSPILSSSVYILGIVIDKAILPLAYFSAILGIVNNLTGRIELGTLTSLFSSLAKWILMATLSLFSAILSLYGFGTNAMNGVARRGLKFAVGSLVPVVGRILTDTVDTVISGANLIKNAAGTSGMIVIITSTFIPIVKICVLMLILKISAAIIEPFSDKRITGLLLTTYDSIKIILGMVITAALLFIISIGIILLASGVNF